MIIQHNMKISDVNYLHVCFFDKIFGFHVGHKAFGDCDLVFIFILFVFSIHKSQHLAFWVTNSLGQSKKGIAYLKIPSNE